MSNVGKRLKTAREAKQIELEDIAEKTKINIKFLRAIDEGNLSFLPEPYVRAFLKTYAQEVGLDGNEVLKQYQETAEIAIQEARPELKEEPEVARFVAKMKKRFQLSDHKIEIALSAVVVGIIISLILIYVKYSPKIFEGSAQEVEEIPFETVVAEMDSSQEVQNPLELSLVASAITWMRISVDDSISEEYTFTKGDVKTWVGREKFVLKIGNAGGVNLKLNGQPLGALGSDGQIMNLVLTKEGIEEKSAR